jgi:hypothetical protein
MFHLHLSARETSLAAPLIGLQSQRTGEIQDPVKATTETIEVQRWLIYL